MNKKILFVAPHRPCRSPSQRYRIEQFLPFLQEKGINYTYAYILNEHDDRIFYKKGNFFLKIYVLIKALIRRIHHLKLLKTHEVVFIQRESYFLGTLFFEKTAGRKSKTIIYDVDDALWIPDTSEGNKFWRFLKSKKKCFKTASIADVVLAGNHWLVEKFRPYNKNVIYFPTVVDTNYYKPAILKENHTIPVIGWIGSSTTIKHLYPLFPLLEKVYKKSPFKFIICSGKDTLIPKTTFDLEFTEWEAEKEVEIINRFDLSVMPLPDEEWVNGKCALKALVCMACGVPVISSAKGVIKEIINDGINGYLAQNDEEWEQKLIFLMENHHKMDDIRKNALETIKKYYSTEVWKNRWLEILMNN